MRVVKSILLNQDVHKITLMDIIKKFLAVNKTISAEELFNDNYMNGGENVEHTLNIETKIKEIRMSQEQYDRMQVIDLDTNKSDVDDKCGIACVYDGVPVFIDNEVTGIKVVFSTNFGDLEGQLQNDI